MLVPTRPGRWTVLALECAILFLQDPVFSLQTLAYANVGVCAGHVDWQAARDTYHSFFSHRFYYYAEPSSSLLLLLSTTNSGVSPLLCGLSKKS